MFNRIFFIAVFLLPILLFAQNDTLKTTLSEVVVSATKTQTPYYAIGSSVSIITSEEISKKQFTNVIDLLKEIPGLSVFQLGGPGMLAYVNMRGTNTNHVLVLINGAEMNDPSSVSNAFDFSSLNTNDIDRIEIVRGPQSTLYGSDAIAGVINIFTKQGDVKSQYSFSGEGGSNNFYRGNFSVSGKQNLVGYFITAGRSGSDGISAANSIYGNDENDGFTNNNISSNIYFDFTNWLQFNLFYKYTNFKSSLDQNEKLGDDPNYSYKMEEQLFKSSASINLFNGNWEQQISTSLVKRFSNTIDGTDLYHPAMSSLNHTNAQRMKFDWQHNLLFINNNLITFGIETETEKANTSYYSESEWGPYESVFPQQSITTTGIYIQDQLNIDNAFFTTLGIRYDDNQKFGNVTTFRFAPAYFISTTGTKLKGSYGTGFKAPSLYYIFDPLFGNPDLKPEKSKGFDFGVEQFFNDGNFHFDITYFNMNLENMFGYDANYRTINIAKASTKGLEISAVVKNIYGFSIATNYTYTKTKDEFEGTADFDKPLIRRPSNKFFIGLNYEGFNNFVLGAQIKYSGERDDKDFSNYTTTRVTLPSYTLVNLNASYKLFEYLQLTARIENLFNKEYEEVLYYGTLGRTFYAGININL